MRKLRLLLASNKFIYLIITILFPILVNESQAAINVDRTRIVINANEYEKGFSLINSSEHDMLLQLWTDRGDITMSPADIHSPVFVLPPIFKMAPGEIKTVRILVNRDYLDFYDRENLLWLNILQVREPLENEADKNANQIILPLRVRLKVLIRPEIIGVATKKTFHDVKFERNKDSLQVVNNRPWYANLLSIRVGNEIFERVTVDPYSSVNLTLHKDIRVQRVEAKFINDEGHIETILSKLAEMP